MKVVHFDKLKGIDWLLNDMKEVEEEEGIELLICIYKKPNGVIGFGATRADELEMMGLIEMGKQALYENMEEE